jgi:DNA-binding XRE family transcriptional regulator
MATTALRSLFNHIEELRRKARLSQVDVATLIGVTRRSYIDWSQGGNMHDHREGSLRYAMFIIEQGLRTSRLPIHGHDRRPITAERRREVIRDLKACYPVNPYSLSE